MSQIQPSLWKPYLAIVSARLREFVRRPEAVFWVYFFPILMVIILGIAFRNKRTEFVSVDIAESPGAVQVETYLQRNPQIHFNRLSLDECKNRLRSGKSEMYVLAESPQLGSVDYFFDPTRPGSLTVKAEVDRALQIGSGRIDPLKTVDHEVNEPGGRYIDFLVPGLLGMGLMGGGLWGVGYAIVDMRIRKLLKRLMATPMRKTDFLLGVMTSRLVFMIPEIVLLIVCSYWLFDVRVYGSYGALFFLVILGAFTFSGVGLLVASRARNIETVSGLMNLVMLPMWTLSGIFFSTEHFPAAAQPLIKALPLTALNDSMRAVMSQGATLFSLWPELAVLLAWGLGSFALALGIFRWND